MIFIWSLEAYDTWAVISSQYSTQTTDSQPPWT